MKKRIPVLLAALFTALILCFALVSCIGEEKSPSVTTTNPNPDIPNPDTSNSGNSDSVTVTFNVAGKTETVTLKKGTVPSYDGSTIKLSDDAYTYRFIGWDKEFAAVNEDTTYTALYDTVPLVTYEVRWILYDREIKTVVKENDIPTPPDIEPVIETNKYIATFTGWQTELVPMTKEHAALRPNRMIKAEYDTVNRIYQVKFMVDGKLYATTEALYEATPTLPEKNPTKSGYNSVMWLGSDQKVTDNEHVCTAVFTINDGNQVLWALNNEVPLSYKGAELDNSTNVTVASNALLFLMYEIRHTDPTTSPYYSTFVNRVVEQLKLMVDPNEDGAPFFDLCCNWPYCNLTSLITLCKNTPAVWDRLTVDEKARYDFIMECFAYVLTLGTDDDNKYLTGPGLTGNYKKEWNPNYRIANFMPMVFVGEYFGGAEPVNAMLLSFDYDTVIAKFQEYGFLRAYNRWTTKPAQKPDGTYYPTPKDFMMNGGKIYLNTYDDRQGYTPGTEAGNGVGVRTEYSAGGATLNNPEKIIASLLDHNYSGGPVKSSYGSYPDGKPKAYIDGYLKSPYEGQLGLMLEFAGTDGGNGKDGPDIRSSSSYCEHDFLMIVSALITLTELDIYDPMDSENISLFRLVWVGNQDLIFKLEKGYMSFSLGAPKGWQRESSANGYLLMKSWWNLKYGHLTLENFPKPTVVFNPLILKEDYTNSNINATVDNNVSYNDVKYSTFEKQGSTMQTVTEGNNSYLKVQVDARGGDPMIDVVRTGGLAALMGEYTSFTISVDLARVEGLKTLEFNYRLRAGNPQNATSIFRTGQNGEVVFGNDEHQKSITTLTTEFQTIAICINFKTETMTAYLNGNEVGTAPLTIPEVSNVTGNTATTGVDWMKTIGNYVCNWYCKSCAGNADNRALLIDNFQIRVDAPQ